MRNLYPWSVFPPNLEPPAARSLSLLFILQELTNSFQLVRHLQKVTPEQLQGANLQKEVEILSQELEKFLVFSLDNPFTPNGGVIDKLCFYSKILLQASKIENEDLLVILEEMRSFILRFKAKLVRWKKALHPLDQILIQFLELYKEIDLKFSTFFSALIPYLQESRTDENVLLYLIEKKEIFNEHLEPRMIENLLARFFPAGFYELRAAICEGFTRRGFANFFAEKEFLINTIEWDNTAQEPVEIKL